MKSFIIANWKLNPQTLAEARKLFNSVKDGVKDVKKAEIVISPPFPYLLVFSPGLVALASQDCFWEREGPYTGEVSAKQLKGLGCQYVILGHSERRRYFKETDEMVNRKIKAALKEKLVPIFCIGETKEERNQGKVEDVLKREIEMGLKGVAEADLSKIVIAYEPIWAIGTGNPCSIEEAQKMGLLIKEIVSQAFGSSKKVKVLYGGSVNSQNAAGYVKEAGLDGLLVGGASLKAKEFIKIVHSVI